MNNQKIRKEKICSRKPTESFEIGIESPNSQQLRSHQLNPTCQLSAQQQLLYHHQDANLIYHPPQMYRVIDPDDKERVMNVVINSDLGASVEDPEAHSRIRSYCFWATNEGRA